MSGHWVTTAVFALITRYRTSKDVWIKPQLEDISNVINVCHTNSIQVLNLDEFPCRFWLCSSNHILKINETIVVGTGTLFTETESLWEQSKHKLHPNANRGWPMTLVNHIQSQLSRLCPKYSWTPTSQNADGAPPYWGFERYDAQRYVWWLSESVFMDAGGEPLYGNS